MRRQPEPTRPGEPTRPVIRGVGGIEPETARRLACDADVIAALVGLDGEVLALGRARRLVSRAQRRALPRETVNVHTQYGDVHVKLSRVNGNIRHVAPEYEDCRKLASEKNVPLQQVINEALRSFERM